MGLAGAQEPAFLQSSQVLLQLLAWGQHLVSKLLNSDWQSGLKTEMKQSVPFLLLWNQNEPPPLPLSAPGGRCIRIGDGAVSGLVCSQHFDLHHLMLHLVLVQVQGRQAVGSEVRSHPHANPGIFLSRERQAPRRSPPLRLPPLHTRISINPQLKEFSHDAPPGSPGLQALPRATATFSGSFYSTSHAPRCSRHDWFSPAEPQGERPPPAGAHRTVSVFWLVLCLCLHQAW